MMGGPRTCVHAEYFGNYKFYYKYHKKSSGAVAVREKKQAQDKKRNRTAGTCLVFEGGNAKETKIYIFKRVSWQGFMLTVLMHTDHTR